MTQQSELFFPNKLLGLKQNCIWWICSHLLFCFYLSHFQSPVLGEYSMLKCCIWDFTAWWLKQTSHQGYSRSLFWPCLMHKLQRILSLIVAYILNLEEGGGGEGERDWLRAGEIKYRWLSSINACLCSFLIEVTSCACKTFLLPKGSSSAQFTVCHHKDQADCRGLFFVERLCSRCLWKKGDSTLLLNLLDFKLVVDEEISTPACMLAKSN